MDGKKEVLSLDDWGTWVRFTVPLTRALSERRRINTKTGAGETQKVCHTNTKARATSEVCMY